MWSAIDLPLLFHPAEVGRRRLSLSAFLALSSRPVCADLTFRSRPACCGFCGRCQGSIHFYRRAIPKSRVRPLLVAVSDPRCNPGSRIGEAAEQALVQELVSHAAVERLHEAVLHGFSRCNEVPGEPRVLALHQHRVRGELRAVVGHIEFRLGSSALAPRRAITCDSSHATRAPEIDVSAIEGRRSRLTSSITLRMRKRRPQASWPCTKSSDQKAFALASTRNRARVPPGAGHAVSSPPALPHGRASKPPSRRSPLSTTRSAGRFCCCLASWCRHSTAAALTGSRRM